MDTRHRTPTVPDFALLERYVAHDCSVEERARVTQWLATDANAKATLDAVRAICEGWQGARAEFDGDDAWNQVADRVRSGRPLATVTPARRQQPLPRMMPAEWRRSALVSMLAAAAVVTAIWIWHPFTMSPVQTRTFATTTGQALAIRLVDGTQVTLAPESRLVVEAKYGYGAQRAVALTGEAYFTVVHNAERPFVVQAHGVVARDVGTVFDMRAYADDERVRVAVLEGAVAVRSQGQGQGKPTLVQGGEIVFADTHGVTVDRLVEARDVVAWMQGGLVFNAVPLKAAVRDIGRAYGADITVADSILGLKRLTATFAGGSLDEVLEAVTQAVGAHYERHGRVVTIQTGVAEAPRFRPAIHQSLVTARTNT